MKNRRLAPMLFFTRKICMIFLVSVLIGCSPSYHSKLWAGDKPKHHNENRFRNYPLIETADTQGFMFIWNRIFSSSKSDKIPANHLIDEKKAIDQFEKMKNENTITWIGHSTQ